MSGADGSAIPVAQELAAEPGLQTVQHVVKPAQAAVSSSHFRASEHELATACGSILARRVALVALSASRAVCLHAAAEKKAGLVAGMAFAAEAAEALNVNVSHVIHLLTGFKPKPNRKRCQGLMGCSDLCVASHQSRNQVPMRTMFKQIQGLATKLRGTPE